jgi:hypothetical protein
MDRLSDQERLMAEELEVLASRRPLYPRAWREEVERRVARTGLEVEEIVFLMKAERGLVAPGPATIPSLLANEKRFHALFEPDELMTEPSGVSARSTAD